VAGRAEFGAFEQRAHDGAFVRGNVGEDLLVGEISEDGRAVFARHQRGAAEGEAARAVESRFGDGMADRAGDALVIEGGERCATLPTGRGADQSAGKERDRRVAGFAVTRRLDAARA
jgi:hypothetical protein